MNSTRTAARVLLGAAVTAAALAATAGSAHASGLPAPKPDQGLGGLLAPDAAAAPVTHMFDPGAQSSTTPAGNRWYEDEANAGRLGSLLGTDWAE
ncbi:hypothetical protein [Yinghuangia seranimata]|uniref:hypothetical protein n=1 Tax=Yinghuangia seranimata TaxID=408067 RepID=UPI00248BF980|nr:hypothetical protein [Yinghuangia seranimata]MDI2125694.1 hypothetical protein [Yinghuangia seranimata]